MHDVESVWDYPRPPRLEPTDDHIVVRHRGLILADTRRSLRVLETSHPPVFYLTPEDVQMHLLRPSDRRPSFCEFKGIARYWTLQIDSPDGRLTIPDIGWSYADPTERFKGLKDHIAFYASRVDECWVNDERVLAQPGDFYGGWITSRVRGPFKGAPGTLGW